MIYVPKFAVMLEGIPKILLMKKPEGAIWITPLGIEMIEELIALCGNCAALRATNKNLFRFVS